MTLSLYIDAPAKINWHLQIVGRRSDGFHELLSCFAALDLCDRVVAETMPGATKSCLQLLSASTQSEHFPLDPSNLILRAEKLWRECGGEAPAIAWSVEKNIPSQAGLGGASSDAAAALMLLQDHATHCLPDAALEHMACLLGSDVPFFLQSNSPALMAGRGDVFVSDISLPATWVVLALPDFSIETPVVFAELNAPNFSGSQLIEANISPDPGPNQLLEAALKVEPRLKEFSEQLAQVHVFHLSGSGSAMFASFSSHAEAQECSLNIEEFCKQVVVSQIITGKVLSKAQSL
ncbi:MAG: 4-diphosphocytidyl-2-C-methyl-D-erythritol kinase [Myxococcota bacterium]|jgi:4-diphosphocytidyl-2-C-methyl-D-erythritol kinase